MADNEKFEPEETIGTLCVVGITWGMCYMINPEEAVTLFVDCVEMSLILQSVALVGECLIWDGVI